MLEFSTKKIRYLNFIIIAFIVIISLVIIRFIVDISFSKKEPDSAFIKEMQAKKL